MRGAQFIANQNPIPTPNVQKDKKYEIYVQYTKRNHRNNINIPYISSHILTRSNYAQDSYFHFRITFSF